MFIGILLQIVVLAAFALRARDGNYPSPDQDGLFPTSLAASPFLLGGMVTGIFASLLYLMLLWRRTDLQGLLPRLTRSIVSPTRLFALPSRC